MRRVVKRLVPAIIIASLGCFIGVSEILAQNVQLVGWLIDTTMHGSDVVIQNSHAYIANSSHGLAVIDVSDPTQPSANDGCTLPWYAFRLCVADGYAYVADIGDGLEIVDLINYQPPRRIGHYYYSNWCFDVAVQGNYAFVAYGGTDHPENRPAGMAIFDISDKTNPIMVSFYETSEFARCIEVRENYAYLGIEPVGAINGNLMIFDISNPADPELISNLVVPNRVWDLCLRGDFACAINYGNLLSIFDIADPTNPGVITQFNTENDLSDIFVSGNYIYLTSGNYSVGLRIYDISNPTSPLLAGRYPMNAGSVYTEGDYIYAAGSDGLFILSFSPSWGSITGIVTTLQTGLPAHDVRVRALPSAFEDTTDSDGRYFIDRLPGFAYDLSLSHHDYFDTTIQDIAIVANDTVILDIGFNHRPASDVGVTAILSPWGWDGNILEGGHYPLKTQITNIGLESETFEIIFEVWLSDLSRLVLADTLTIYSMPPISQDSVTLSRELVPVLGESYLAKSYSALFNDENHTNDTSITYLRTLPPTYLIYGNRDGSVMPVRIGSTIEIPAWGATPGNNYRDSVTYMHNPLSSNDSVIAARLGGFFPDTLVGRWDDRSFLPAAPDPTAPGWTNQSMLGFAYLGDPRDPQNFFWTNGDTLLICTFRLQIAADTSLIGQTLCPFKEGYDRRNEMLLWGMQDGFTGYAPIATYPRLYFLPQHGPCEYILGDVNGDGFANGVDVIYSANYFKYGGNTPPDSCACPPIDYPFFAAGDVNANCVFNGIDIIYMVNYYKGLGPAFTHCIYCPPDEGERPAGIDETQRMQAPKLNANYANDKMK